MLQQGFCNLYSLDNLCEGDKGILTKTSKTEKSPS